MEDLIITIVLMLFGIELIVSAIIGFVKKEINGRVIFVKVYTFPARIIGFIIGLAGARAFKDEVDTGKTAFVTSFSVLIVGLLFIFFPIIFFLDTNGITSEKFFNTSIPLLLSLVIVILIGLIIFVSRKK